MVTTSLQAQPLPFIHPDEMPGVYALTGYGDCMRPLIADGEVLVFSKTASPQPGDVVSVIFTQEAGQRSRVPGLIKRLALPLPPLAGLIVVDQINPPRRYAIPSTDVLAVHRCMGVGESDGDRTVRLSRPFGRGEVVA